MKIHVSAGRFAELFQKHSAKELAEMFGVTLNHVYAKKKLLNLKKKRPPRYKLNMSKNSFAKVYYSQTTIQAAKTLNCGVVTIIETAKRFGLSKRNKNGGKR